MNLSGCCTTEDDFDTGWRRCTRRLKLQVSFRKRATNHRALLRKITYKDKAMTLIQGGEDSQDA